MRQQLAVDTIVVDKRFQSRVKGIDEQHVTDLMEAYQRPDSEIECPRVWNLNGIGMVLTRGFHRVEALKRLGRKRIEVEVKNGDVADALVDAAGSNSAHGLKRSNADKRRCVTMILEAHPDWSSRRVSEEAGVSTNFVSELRDEKDSNQNQVSSDDTCDKVVGRDGKKQSARKKKKKNDATPEPVSQSDDGTIEQSTDEQVKPVDEKSLPSQAWQEIRLEKGDPPVEVVGRITEVKGFPTPRIIRWKNAKGKITEKVFDMTGNPIPNTMGDVFVNNDLRDILVQLETAAEMIDAADEALLKAAAAEIDAVQFAWVDFVTINSAMKKFRDSAIDVIDVVRNGLPFAVCPGCNGNRNGCKECRLTGYWPRFEVESQPKRFRKIEGIAS